MSYYTVWNSDDEDKATLKFIERQKVRVGGLDDYFKKLQKVTKTRITKRANGTLSGNSQAFTDDDKWIEVSSLREPGCTCRFYPHTSWCVLNTPKKNASSAVATTGSYCTSCGLAAPQHRTWCGIGLSGMGMVPFCEACGNSIKNHKFDCSIANAPACNKCGLKSRHEPWCVDANITLCWSCKNPVENHADTCIYTKAKKGLFYIKCPSCYTRNGRTLLEVSYPDINCIKCKSLLFKRFEEGWMCVECGNPTIDHMPLCPFGK